jgi:hypothetical protein
MSKTLKEIERELKSKGAKNKDIAIGLSILPFLAKLDRALFPEKPAVINFSLKKPVFEMHAGHYPDKRTNVRYSIFLKDLAELLKKQKRRKVWLLRGKKGILRERTWKELLFCIAGHEVRHRIQHDRKIKKFSPASAKKIKDYQLRSIIEFTTLYFEEKKSTYLQEKRSKCFIRARTSIIEFDAQVIEKMLFHVIRENTYFQEKKILSVLQLQSP